MPVTGDAAVDGSTRRVVFRPPPGVEFPRENLSTTLFCGTPQQLSAADFYPQRPWRVQFLPIQDLPPPPLPGPKSNGCGAVVHNCAIPNSVVIWEGGTAAVTDVALPLEDQYVPKALRDIMETRREECGCSRNPVGCAVCGNPLGVLIDHCVIHTYLKSTARAYEFLPSAVSPPIPPLLLRSAHRRPLTPTPRVRDTLLSRLFHGRRFDDTATPGARAGRHTPRAVTMNEDADEVVLFSGFRAIAPRPPIVSDAGETELSVSHAERATALSILDPPEPRSELFSYDRFLWTGPRRGFIPGRRSVQLARS
ncbi:hypothetical protein B0H14DRAFT_2691958 [Mycena olivaceomarginata]|nr:hypothetical protein B0H14DRAFT_2691958 [Mycena olivaceomarginata]